MTVRPKVGNWEKHQGGNREKPKKVGKNFDET